MSFLQRLRQKPSYVKSQIAFIGALFITGIVAFVWVMSLPARFEKVGADTEGTLDEPTFFENAFSRTRDQLGSVVSSIQNEEGEEGEIVETNNDEAPIEAPEPLFELTEDGVVVNEVTHTLEAEPDIQVEEVMSSTTATTTETRAPKVILIGTTTSQKSPQKSE